jgi:hypothetical protein
MFGVFRVKNHQKILFFPILGGRAPGAPPGSALINKSIDLVVVR